MSRDADVLSVLHRAVVCAIITSLAWSSSCWACADHVDCGAALEHLVTYILKSPWPHALSAPSQGVPETVRRGRKYHSVSIYALNPAMTSSTFPHRLYRRRCGATARLISESVNTPTPLMTSSTFLAGGSGGGPARPQNPVQGLQRARRDAGLPQPALPTQLPPRLRAPLQLLPEGVSPLSRWSLVYHRHSKIYQL
jgi:hypothetical protein